MIVSERKGGSVMTIKAHSRALQAPGEGDGPAISDAHVGADVFGLWLRFTTARGYNQYTGKYGGSLFTVRPDSGSFAAIAKAMMEADPHTAIKAFGAALSEGIPGAEQASKAA